MQNDDLLVVVLISIILYQWVSGVIRRSEYKKQTELKGKTIIEALCIARQQFNDSDKLALFMQGFKDIQFKNLPAWQRYGFKKLFDKLWFESIRY